MHVVNLKVRSMCCRWHSAPITFNSHPILAQNLWNWLRPLFCECLLQSITCRRTLLLCPHSLLLRAAPAYDVKSSIYAWCVGCYKLLNVYRKVHAAISLWWVCRLRMISSVALTHPIQSKCTTRSISSARQKWGPAGSADTCPPPVTRSNWPRCWTGRKPQLTYRRPNEGKSPQRNTEVNLSFQERRGD